MLGPSMSLMNDHPACNLRTEAKLLIVIGFITKHADYRISFILYAIRL